jgi:hypothetical protein
MRTIESFIVGRPFCFFIYSSEATDQLNEHEQ